MPRNPKKGKSKSKSSGGGKGGGGKGSAAPAALNQVRLASVCTASPQRADARSGGLLPVLMLQESSQLVATGGIGGAPVVFDPKKHALEEV